MLRARVWIAAGMLCLGVTAAYVPMCSALLERRARVILENVSSLYRTPGRTPTFAEAQRMFKGKLRPMEGCTAAECSYQYELNNRLLSNMGLAPFSEIQTYMWVENGYVRTVVLDFTSTANNVHSVVSHVFIQDGGGPILNQKGLEFELDPWEQSSPSDTNGIVSVSPDSLRAHEPVVLGFDVGCLVRRGGCATVADLLPTVWERRSDGAVRCRLPNNEGFIESPWPWINTRAEGASQKGR